MHLMLQAFLFDMDGVMTDSERRWAQSGVDAMLIDMFGREIWDKHFRAAHGHSIKTLYDRAIKSGGKYDYDLYNQRWYAMAEQVYRHSRIADGLEDLIDWLHGQGIKLGVVSGSPTEWVDLLVARLRNADKLGYRLSVNDHSTLKTKPHPDPYLQAMRDLAVTPKNCAVIEDSLVGVQSAKASGAFTICSIEFVGHDAHARNADAYVSRLAEIKPLLKIRFGLS